MVVPTPRIFPNCHKCGCKEFDSQASSFKKIPVIIIFCNSCGAVLGIVNGKADNKPTSAPGPQMLGRIQPVQKPVQETIQEE